MTPPSEPPLGPRHRRRWIIILTAAVVGAGAVLWMVFPKEPTYEGRTLSTWLTHSDDPERMPPPSPEEINRAVRAMRADQVWPVLLDMARSRDSALRLRCMAAGTRWNLPILRSLRPAEARQEMAVNGFTVMGETGGPAVAELTKMLDDPELAVIAVRCLAGVGKPAEAALCRSLTNAESSARYQAVFAIGPVTDGVELLIDRLKVSLHDPDESVRDISVIVIGWHATAPEKVVPVLVEALADRSAGVSATAYKSLSRFGTNAAAAIPALIRNTEETRGIHAKSALKALSAISPPAALPIALRQLTNSAPSRRVNAAMVLGTYKSATPEIIAALENAATDTNELVVYSATKSLEKLRRTPGTSADPAPKADVK